MPWIALTLNPSPKFGRGTLIRMQDIWASKDYLTLRSFSDKGLLPFSQIWEKGLGDEGFEEVVHPIKSSFLSPRGTFKRATSGGQSAKCANPMLGLTNQVQQFLGRC
jgi:hypothetical protein